MRDARFGLPLSLVEALRADRTPVAAELADMLADDDAPCPTPPPRPLRTALFGLAAMVGASVATSSHATTSTLEGRWTMRPEASSFQERVTGPAPDVAVMVVTRDDADHLTYELIESRRGSETARAAYDVSFDGAPSTSRAGGAAVGVTAARDVAGAVLVRGARVGPYQAVIRVRRTGRDTATLEHTVEGPKGVDTLERLSLIRTDGAATPQLSGGYAVAVADEEAVRR